MALEENEEGFYDTEGKDTLDRVFYGEDENGRFIRYQARLYFEHRRDLKIREDGRVEFETNEPLFKMIGEDTQQLSMEEEAAENLVDRYHRNDPGQLEEDLERFYEWVTELEDKIRERYRRQI